MVFAVGLTGGIGSGKSTVADLFARQGAMVIDTDLIAHQLSQKGSAVMQEICKVFGQHYLTQEGELDRARMRTLIFQDAGARQQLEDIFHPAIYDVALHLLQENNIQAPYAILVVPLLFEAENYLNLVQRTLVVDCPEEVQIARVMARSDLSAEMAAKIIAAQYPREKRLARADDIIDNSDGIDQLIPQVMTLHYHYSRFHGINKRLRKI